MQEQRRHAYFALMGTCILLIVLAWNVVRLWSVTAAVAMSGVALVIPPVAAIVANRRGPDDHWWDEDENDGTHDDARGPDAPGGTRAPGRGPDRDRPGAGGTPRIPRPRGKTPRR